jgi:superfamily II DNA or RNA helicase
LELNRGMMVSMRIEVRLDNRLRMRLDELPEGVADSICARFAYRNPDHGKAQAFGFRAKRIPKFIATYRRGDGELSVPRGGLGKLRAVLTEHGLSWHVVDERAEGFVGGPLLPKTRVQLYPFQQRMVRAALERQNCLWRCPQGGGKTTAALAFAAETGLPTLVVVSTANLLQQWRRRALNDLGVDGSEVGVVGDGQRRVRFLTLGMAQTLSKCVGELRGQFGVVIQDEVQQAGAASFNAVIDELDCKYRLGVSGDERRADHKEFLVYDQFGDVVVEVERDELEDDGFVLPVEVRVVFSGYDCAWWRDLARLPRREGESDNKHRQRILRRRIQEQEQFTQELCRDPARNALVTDLVHTSIEEAGQAVVLSARREHCHVLQSLLVGEDVRTGLLIGGDDYAQQFDLTLRQFTAREVAAAVGTYQAIGVGFDLPQAARGVLATPVANSRDGAQQFRQFCGRFARTAEGKRDAALYYVLDRVLFGYWPLRNLIRWCGGRVKVETPAGWVDAKGWLKHDAQADRDGDDEERELGQAALFGGERT